VLGSLELPAGVQRGHDDLEGRLAVLLEGIDRDAAAVVLDGDRLAVGLQGHVDAAGVAIDDLVDGVVDDLPEQVVVAGFAGATDVHRRALAHRLEPLEDGDVLGGVVAPGHQWTPWPPSPVASGWMVTGASRSLSVARLTICLPLPPRA